MHQVRRILPHDAALLESLHDQADVALLQVAHAPVHQFGAAAGGALPEVGLLQQEDIVAASRRVQRRADAGGPSPDQDHVPGFLAIIQAVEHLFAVVASSLPAGQTSGLPHGGRPHMYQAECVSEDYPVQSSFPQT